ncbi:MAG: tRNA (adenosine(37)-N6)-threonylcarbamoyltransferase complex dimerization subunit type 1 TsaB [Candidatus Aminicenantales bacterium]
MRILAVDTTTETGSVALLENTRLLSEVNLDSPLTHSGRLLQSVHFLLQANAVTIQQVDGFAVAAGPGSFTGIRIGLSTVKSFSFASEKPVAPVSTLKGLAWKLRDSGSRLLCPVMDAKKGEIYASLFEVKGGRLTELISQGAYSPDHFLSRLPAHRIILFIGSGVQPYKSRILDYLKDKARLASRSTFIAHEVGLLGYEILNKQEGVLSSALEPFYFRKSQAEEKH